MKLLQRFKRIVPAFFGGTLIIFSSLAISSCSCSSPEKVKFISMSNTGILSNYFALYTKDVPITSAQQYPIDTYASTGAKVNATYSITPSLPEGLSFNNKNGVISGTPVSESPEAQFTIKAKYQKFTDEETIGIEVDDGGAYKTLNSSDSALTGWNVTSGDLTFWYSKGTNKICRIYDGDGRDNPTTASPTTRCAASGLNIKKTISFVPEGSSIITTYDVVGVRENAFLANVDIAGSLTFPQDCDKSFHIFQNAFGFCTKLFDDIKFPNKLASIGTRAFERASRETPGLFIRLIFNSQSTIQLIPDYCFDRARLGNLVGPTSNIGLPTSLKKIGKWAFSNSQIHGDVIFPEGLLEIDEYAFTGYGDKVVAQNGDMRMKIINLPDSLTTLGQGAFYWSTFQDEDGLTNELKLGEHLQYMGRRAFALLSINVLTVRTPYATLNEWAGSGDSNAIFWDWKSFSTGGGSHHFSTGVIIANTPSYNPVSKLNSVSYQCPSWRYVI